VKIRRIRLIREAISPHQGLLRVCSWKKMTLVSN